MARTKKIAAFKEEAPKNLDDAPVLPTSVPALTKKKGKKVTKAQIEAWSHPNGIVIRNPETGDEEIYTAANARDLMDLRGWTLVKQFGKLDRRYSIQAALENSARVGHLESDDGAEE
jgi:hypothetical protein